MYDKADTATVTISVSGAGSVSPGGVVVAGASKLATGDPTMARTAMGEAFVLSILPGWIVLAPVIDIAENKYLKYKQTRYI